jgi:hypothetical protein
MTARKNDAFRILRIKKSDDLKAIYAKAKKAFTAADLQRVTDLENEKWIPAEQLLAELEAIHREELSKLRKRRKRKRKVKP